MRDETKRSEGARPSHLLLDPKLAACGSAPDLCASCAATEARLLEALDDVLAYYAANVALINAATACDTAIAIQHGLRAIRMLGGSRLYEPGRVTALMFVTLSIASLLEADEKRMDEKLTAYERAER